MIKNFLDTFITGFTSTVARRFGLNYLDEDQGLRHPRTPSGVLVQNDGNVQLYAGSSYLVVDNINNGIGLESKTCILKCGDIEISTQSIKDLVLLGRYFDSELFYGVKEVLTVSNSKEDLSNYKLITSLTQVDNAGKIHGTSSLASIFESRPLTIANQVMTESADRVSRLASAIGHDIPKVVKRLSSKPKVENKKK